MCFKFWIPNRQPARWEIPFTGAGATLSVLMGKSIEELSRTTGMDATASMSWDEIVWFYQQAGYRPTFPSGLKPYPIFGREDFKNQCIYKFNQQLKQTASHKKANLRMKMPVAWFAKYKRGKVQHGQVLLLKCWLDQEDGQVAYGVMDYRDDPSGKQIRLPQEDKVVGYWSFEPMFYQKK